MWSKHPAGTQNVHQMGRLSLAEFPQEAPTLQGMFKMPRPRHVPVWKSDLTPSFAICGGLGTRMSLKNKRKPPDLMVHTMIHHHHHHHHQIFPQDFAIFLGFSHLKAISRPMLCREVGLRDSFHHELHATWYSHGAIDRPFDGDSMGI